MILMLALAQGACSSEAPEDIWTTDLAAAKQQAAAENKDLLLDFTGSDWCGWCIKLDEEIFSTTAFREAVVEDFVPVEIDFPQEKEQSQEIKARNQKLQERYGVEGFPTIYLADAQGRPYARTGYQEGGAEAYIAHLDELQQERVERDEALEAARALSDVEKARALDAVLQSLAQSGVPLNFYEDVMEEIIVADANNEAGLKRKYEQRELVEAAHQQLTAAMQAYQQSQGQQVPDWAAMMEQYADVPQAQQLVLSTRAQVQYSQGQQQQAIDLLKQARDLEPDSQTGQQLAQLIPRLEERLEQSGGGDGSQPEAPADGSDAGSAKEDAP
ncbi:MAG: thioredoxin family protein [Planctomycetota bacterium]